MDGFEFIHADPYLIIYLIYLFMFIYLFIYNNTTYTANKPNDRTVESVKLFNCFCSPSTVPTTVTVVD